MLHLSAAGTHTDPCLLAFCQKGHKHLFPPQDSHTNGFVERQEDGLQGSWALTAPAPPTNSGTCLIQTLTA